MRDTIIEAIQKVFPDHQQIVEAREFGSGFCFRVIQKDGSKRLAWVGSKKLSGISQTDKNGCFKDFTASTNLHHQNILSPLSTASVGDKAIVVTEDFEGTAAIQLIADDKLPDNDTLENICTFLLPALAAAHQAGLLHRAINPANILVDKDGDVRIFGFGIANIFFDCWQRELNRYDRNCVDYCAPEIHLLGLVDSTITTECFSIGCLLFEITMGHLPDRSSLILPSQTRDLPTYYDDALLNAMHGDPNQRPQSIDQLRMWINGEMLREFSNDKQKNRYQNTLDRLLNVNYMDILAVVGIAAAVIATAITLYFVVTDEDDISVDQIVKQASQAVLSERSKVSTEDIKALHEHNSNQLEQVITDVQKELTSEQDYKEAKKFLEKVDASVPLQPSIAKRVNAWILNIDEFLYQLQIAEQALQSGNLLVESHALKRAAKLFPDNRDVANRAQRNPHSKTRSLLSALARVREDNPEQKKWQPALVVSQDHIKLDLSGHHAIRDIQELENLSINELNLSGTGIRDLSPLKGMPLTELQIDQTLVSDLSPLLSSTTLRTLTFRQARVENQVNLNEVESLRSVIGHINDTPFHLILPPELDQVTWVNELGLKFRRLPDTYVFIAEREFPYGDGKDPLTGLSYNDAIKKCEHMTLEARQIGSIGATYAYRLPTDLEWSRAAALPESPFLSPQGRSLQSMSPTEYDEALRLQTIFEINPYSPTNGFFGLDNQVGEWVDQEKLAESALIRGLPRRTKLLSLRTRYWEAPDLRFQGIGFRPVLEIEHRSSEYERVLSNKANIDELAHLSLKKWKHLHLSAAAASGVLLDSIENSDTYRLSYIQSCKKDPFTNNHYLRIDLPLEWKEARKLALRLGGKLSSATSPEHLTWLQNNFVSRNPLGTPVWVGGYFDIKSRSWLWENQNPIPTNFKLPKTDGTAERLGAILHANSDTLQSASISDRHSFIIEWDPRKLDTTEPLLTRSRE